jgi:hypothetical protein
MLDYRLTHSNCTLTGILDSEHTHGKKTRPIGQNAKPIGSPVLRQDFWGYLTARERDCIQNLSEMDRSRNKQRNTAAELDMERWPRLLVYIYIYWYDVDASSHQVVKMGPCGCTDFFSSHPKMPSRKQSMRMYEEIWYKKTPVFCGSVGIPCLTHTPAANAKVPLTFSTIHLASSTVSMMTNAAFAFLAENAIPQLFQGLGVWVRKNTTYHDIIWLVVLIILKNISQWEGLSYILWKKNVWNHQPV